MEGYGGRPGYAVVQGGEFAYLQLDMINAADVAFEANTEHATTLIAMRETTGVPAVIGQDLIQVIAKSGDWLIVLCIQVTPQTIAALVDLAASPGAARLAVFCPRPKALVALLAERGVEANAYSIADALLRGQTGNQESSVLSVADKTGAAP